MISVRVVPICAVLVATVLASACARIAVATSDNNNTVDIAKPEDSDVSTARQAGSEPEQGSEDAGSLMPWTMGAMRVMRKVYLECRDEDLSSCLKVQLVRAMDRVARSSKRIALMAGVTLERDPEAQLDDKIVSKDDLENSLPRSLPERERSLDKLILDRFFNFFQSYSLRLKLPSIAELSSSVEEARRRPGGQFNGLMTTGLLLGGSLLPMKFGMLAMLAGKALMLSKLALAISALMATRNMGGGGGGGSGGSSHHH